MRAALYAIVLTVSCALLPGLAAAQCVFTDPIATYSVTISGVNRAGHPFSDLGFVTLDASGQVTGGVYVNERFAGTEFVSLTGFWRLDQACIVFLWFVRDALTEGYIQ